MASKGQSTTGKTYGNKTIYVSDWDVWERLVTHAKKQNKSVSEVIHEAIVRVLEPANDDAVKLQKIREILG